MHAVKLLIQREEWEGVRRALSQWQTGDPSSERPLAEVLLTLCESPSSPKDIFESILSCMRNDPGSLSPLEARSSLVCLLQHHRYRLDIISLVLQDFPSLPEVLDPQGEQRPIEIVTQRLVMFEERLKQSPDLVGTDRDLWDCARLLVANQANQPDLPLTHAIFLVPSLPMYLMERTIKHFPVFALKKQHELGTALHYCAAMAPEDDEEDFLEPILVRCPGIASIRNQNGELAWSLAKRYRTWQLGGRILLQAFPPALGETEHWEYAWTHLMAQKESLDFCFRLLLAFPSLIALPHEAPNRD